jgi:hypothetical protein
MIRLTKSRFLSGLQCSKRLWFEVHEPLKDHSGDTMALVNGRAVDELIQGLQPGRVVSREAGMAAAVRQTRDILSQGAPPVLYQGAFQEGLFEVVVDVLRRKDNAFDLIEVKASTEATAEHLSDVAFQALVLQRAGLCVGRAYICHANKAFVLKQPGSYAGLLVETDVTAQVRALLPIIARDAEEYTSVMTRSSAPRVSVGNQCEHPYPCPFIERCDHHRDRPERIPLSILPRGTRVVAKLHSEGYEDLRDVPEGLLRNAEHRRIHAATTSGRPVTDPDAAADLRRLAPPFAYLDFETINLAVPEVIGTRPYEQCPFQWSLHVEQPDGGLHHADYLEVARFEDLHALASQLLEALPARGPVFVYNKSLEEGVLILLARLLPGLAPSLHEVVRRLVDLWPITKAAYYHPRMLGSWSLKAVLPTIEPSLNYDDLEEIRDGGGAQMAFFELRQPLSSERQAELAERLKAYCKRDTYGMVVLRRFLSSLQ